MTDNSASTPGIEDEPAPEVALIPIDEDTDAYLALGPLDVLPTVQPAEPMSFSGTGSLNGIRDLAGALNVPVQVLAGWESSRHLVRLSPETVRLLKGGARLMQSAGANLGVLKGADGKIIGVARFASAGSALSLAASLGSALSTVAIQMQLSEINARLARIEEAVARVEAAVADLQQAERTEMLSRAAATIRSVSQVWELARAADRSTAEILSQVSGFDRDLDQTIRQLEADIRRRLAKKPDRATRKDIRDWEREHGEALEEDITMLAWATEAHLRHDLLHAALLLGSDHQANTRAARVKIDQARANAASHDKLLIRAGDAVRRAYLLSDRPRRATAVAEPLEAIGIALPPIPAFPTIPSYGTGPSRREMRWKSRAVLLLDQDEQPQFVIHGRGFGQTGNDGTQRSLILVTDQRMIGLDTKRFVNRGSVKWQAPLSQLKGARETNSWDGQDVYRVLLIEPARGKNRELDISTLAKKKRRRMRARSDAYIKAGGKGAHAAVPQPSLPARDPLALLSTPDMRAALESASR